MLERIYRHSLSGEIGPDGMAVLHRAFGEAFSTRTLQGFSFRKPHGYAGDFEIIDRIYGGYICPDPHLAAWDRYYQYQAAPQAVRNRKAYFLDLFRRMRRPEGRSLEVLNLASGPGSDMRELLRSHWGAGLRFDCVEQDPAAIAHASLACREASDRIRFFHGNVVTHKLGQDYDVIWSAGLFGSFDDALFRRMVKRLLPALRPGGRLIIGNFSPVNPSRPYMHLLDWPLRYRSADHLHRLAEACGVAADRIGIGQEPLGINLFLRIRAS